MSDLISRSVAADLATDDDAVLDARLKELYGLSAEIVDLFHTQAFSSDTIRSEEHTSELQSRQYLVCRLLLEKKKKKNNQQHTHKNNTPNNHTTYIMYNTRT